MLRLFKNKTDREKLNVKYKKLLEEAHQLSTSNRSASDAKHAEAQKVLQQLEALDKS